MLREFKLSVITLDTGSGELEGQVEKFDLDEFLSIEVLPIDKEMEEKRKRFNRAKEKEEFKKRVQEQLDEDYDLYI